MQNQQPPAGAPVTDAAPNLVAGRSCDGCTMCCKLFAIPAVPKAEGVWCQHCDIGKGCTIYEARPKECRDFFCHYRLDIAVPEHWKPSQSHMTMRSDASGVWIVVHVDPARPHAWRETPYYEDLKRWSANRLQADKLIRVRVAGRLIVVLPDRDVDLGQVGDRVVATNKTWTPQGPRLDFELIERDDPRVQAQAGKTAPPNPFRW